MDKKSNQRNTFYQTVTCEIKFAHVCDVRAKNVLKRAWDVPCDGPCDVQLHFSTVLHTFLGKTGQNCYFIVISKNCVHTLLMLSYHQNS